MNNPTLFHITYNIGSVVKETIYANLPFAFATRLKNSLKSNPKYKMGELKLKKA